MCATSQFLDPFQPGSEHNKKGNSTYTTKYISHYTTTVAIHIHTSDNISSTQLHARHPTAEQYNVGHTLDG